jgi:hypothetical protein
MLLAKIVYRLNRCTNKHDCDRLGTSLIRTIRERNLGKLVIVGKSMSSETNCKEAYQDAVKVVFHYLYLL